MNDYTEFIRLPRFAVLDDSVNRPVVSAYRRATGRAPAGTDVGHGFWKLAFEGATLAELEAHWRAAEPLPVPDFVSRPIVANMLGPLRNRQERPTGYMESGYFAPSLCSVSARADRLEILRQHAANGARQFPVMAQWSGAAVDARGDFGPSGWSGDRDYYNAYEDLDDFGAILDEIVSVGLGPIVFLAERARDTFGDFTVSEVLEMGQEIARRFGDRVALIVPEIETDEIRRQPERARLMSGLRRAFDRVGIHWSSNMPTDSNEYAGLPEDSIVLGQAPRGMGNLAELKQFAAGVNRACKVPVVNFEHSSSKRLSLHTAAQATARARALARGGWIETGNALSHEARVLCMLEHRAPTAESIDRAWGDLRVAVPGIVRASKAGVWFPGLRGGLGVPDSQQMDVIRNVERPELSEWQWLARGWDGMATTVAVG